MLDHWLQLLLAKAPPVALKRKLVTAMGSPQAVLAAPPQARAAALAGQGAVALPSVRAGDVAAAHAVLKAHGAGFIGFNEPGFPPLLNYISGAPLGLFVLGDPTLLTTPQLAIVGSRSATPSGRRTAEQFAKHLSDAGLTITSGLASGIDGCAHRGCLAAGGRTIAVMATGIDRIYPAAHRALGREISERGLIVSEYLPGTPPRAQHFPQRNRIISGLSLGTLVVEAGVRSGSLITARLAGEQGREVFAIPGSIHVEVSRGCHRLLRQGAKLVETKADILEELGHFFTAHDADEATREPVAATPRGPLGELYRLIDHTPASVDQLIEQSGLNADEISQMLTELELDGLIAATDGGYQRLPPPGAA